MNKFIAAFLPSVANCLLVIVLLGGCTYSRVTRYGSSLTREELERETMALAAITESGGGEAVSADALAARIERHFRKARPWLNVLPIASVRTNFDASEYRQALQQISEGVDWSPDDLTVFSRLTNHTRYLLLVNLHSQVERKGSYQTPNAVSFAFAALWSAVFGDDSDCDDNRWDDSEPEVEMDTVKYGTLALDTQLGIYDLQAKRMVWLAACRVKLREEDVYANCDPQAGTAIAPSPSGFEAVDRALKMLSTRLPK
jgi:hypothetical protein